MLTICCRYQPLVFIKDEIVTIADAARRGNVHHGSPRDCRSRGSSKYCGDVRDKTFFTHVMPENCAIVSKSAVFTHARSLAAW